MVGAAAATAVGSTVVLSPVAAGNLLTFAELYFSPDGAGMLVASLGVAGSALFVVRGRPVDLLILVAISSYLAMAAWTQMMDPEPRHLHPIFPFLSIAAAFLVVTAARWFGERSGSRTQASRMMVALGVVSSAPGMARTLDWIVIQGRDDTRTLALRWLEENVPAGARILNDKECVRLRPSSSTIRRRMERLRGDVAASGIGPFTHHKSKLLEWQLRVAEERESGGVPTYDLVVLEPPWWRRDEARGSGAPCTVERDLGNPIADRMPRGVGEYRGAGIEYVVTSSGSYRQYRHEPWKSRWPTFHAFYRDLERLVVEVEFEDDWSRRPGPAVRVYRLR